MYTAYITHSEMLSRKVCFKTVLAWIQDAMSEFKIDRVVVVPDAMNAPAVSGERIIRITKPVVFSPLLEGGHTLVTWPDGDVPVTWGCAAVSTAEELQSARRTLQAAIIKHHIQNGVDVVDPYTTFIGPDVTIGHGTTILPGVVIQGKCAVGEGCELGPFTHIRPDVTMGEGVKAGAFVEIKNSVMGDRSHAGHLTYVGDADVGMRVNFGCGTVTVNYDGSQKHRTVVHDDAFIGCNTNLVAPVTIGRNAYTAAGSTITGDVPAKALAIARARQVNKENWKSPRARSDD